MMGPTRVRSCSGACILTDARLCGSISRRRKPNSHAGRDEDWDIQEGHRSVRVYQRYKLARRPLRFESPLPVSFAHSSMSVSSQKLSQRCTRSLPFHHRQNSLRQRVLCRSPSIRVCTMSLGLKVPVLPVLPHLEDLLAKWRRGRYRFQPW